MYRTMAILATLLLAANVTEAARPLGNVVTREAARRYGLERAWATQIELDRSRGRVAFATLNAGLLLVQTDQATLHVLDAETRRTLWIAHVGRPGPVTSPPAANDKYVVSTSGSVAYLFERASGRVLSTRKMPSVPSTGAAISDTRIYIPQVNGMITTFRLPSEKNKEETPMEQRFRDNAANYMGKGIAFAPPVVTEQGVVWGTDAGNIYSVTPHELYAMFRFKCHAAVLGGVLYRAPYIYATSRDGYIYALRDGRGFARWQISIGRPMTVGPMVTEDGVYAIPETGGIFKLSPETGEEIWSAPGPQQFVAASPTRLYTADIEGRLLILDVKSGARLGTLGTQGSTIKVFNRDNDRVYLLTSTGLAQCLHEVGLKEPASHKAIAISDEDKKEDADKEDKPKAEKPAADEGPDPFGADDKMPADDDADAMADDAMDDEK